MGRLVVKNIGIVDGTNKNGETVLGLTDGSTFKVDDVGYEEGKVVGIDAGSEVKIAVVIDVVEIDGKIVSVDGLRVEIVGIDVGCEDSEEVGFNVGSGVGNKVGIDVGYDDGKLVGSDVASEAGFTVSIDVGYDD